MDHKGEWLSDALYPIFHFRKWNGIKFERLHGAMGYMSEILRIYPDWEGEHLPESFVVKIPTFSMGAEKALDAPTDNNKSGTSETATLVKIFHRTESKVYELFQQLDSSPVPVPRVYFNRNGNGLTNDDFSVLVMEDLAGYSMVDIVESFNDKQMYALVDAIVDLHVYSFTKTGWESLGFTAEMYALVDAIVDLHVYSFTKTGWESLGFTAEEIDEVGSIATVMVTLADRLKQRSPYHFGKLDLLMEFLGEGDWQKRYLTSCRNGEVLCALTHGDLWTANVMWENNSLKAIIDWQLAHRGSITEDIMKILCTCISVESRKRLTTPLLTYYYNQLKNKLTDSGHAIPFTFDDVKKSYRSTLPYMAMMAVFSAAFWSNCEVLKDETNAQNEEKRIKEIFDRTKSIIEEAIENGTFSC
ncbi:putative oxidoreductase dhs-27 [Toxocara canis]|uniref:Putative oxidoreductase dhs-27 n=1 Tax=Toxocara canis TaxID=6265 RepID=A0A0B2V217_TOXCA|nr:putative oxidoreductase dhs-27 [Toxocara canis]